MKGKITMTTLIRNVAIKKIIEMPETRVAKLLIFMAGMEAEHTIGEKNEIEQPDGELSDGEIQQRTNVLAGSKDGETDR